MGGKNSYESIKRYEDKVLVRLPKGQKEIIKAHIDPQGKSVNGFINEAIVEKLDREKAGPGADSGPAEVKKETGE